MKNFYLKISDLLSLENKKLIHELSIISEKHKCECIFQLLNAIHDYPDIFNRFLYNGSSDFLFLHEEFFTIAFFYNDKKLSIGYNYGDNKYNFHICFTKNLIIIDYRAADRKETKKVRIAMIEINPNVSGDYQYNSYLINKKITDYIISNCHEKKDYLKSLIELEFDYVISETTDPFYYLLLTHLTYFSHKLNYE